MAIPAAIVPFLIATSIGSSISITLNDLLPSINLVNSSDDS